MDFKFFHINKQTKYILTELLLGSLIIAVIASAAINNIENKMDKTYADFAQLMTGTLAIQASSFEEIQPDAKQYYLAHEAALLLDRHEDVSFVEYKDKNNKIIYSSKNDFPVADENTIVKVSSPI
ncbi:MAG: hypothetical protein LUH11_03205, partial [Candidatus Gastranaerophilales bacterium]|nr:hypothetical protein [Candidatus Gastranaerophilales bacterium]